VISNITSLQKAFKNYPGILEPFKAAENLSKEDCIYFTAHLSASERGEFLSNF
jgi:hypothetical protein